MAVGIYQPPQKQVSQSVKRPGAGSWLGGGLGAVVGGVGGFFTGGPAGAVGGAIGGYGVGSQIGGNIEGAGKTSTHEVAVPGGAVEKPDSAIKRRLAAMEDDHIAALRDAAIALPNLPEPVRQEYGPPIMQAYMKAVQGGGQA